MAKKGSKMSATPVPNSPKKAGSGKGTGANPFGYNTASGAKGGKTPGLQGKSGKC